METTAAGSDCWTSLATFLEFQVAQGMGSCVLLADGRPGAPSPEAAQERPALAPVPGRGLLWGFLWALHAFCRQSYPRLRKESSHKMCPVALEVRGLQSSFRAFLSHLLCKLFLTCVPLSWD